MTPANLTELVVRNTDAKSIEAGPVCRRIRGHIAHHMRDVRLPKCGGIDDFLAVNCAASELQTQPLRHISGGGTDATCWALCVWLAHLWLPFSIHRSVQRGMVWIVDEVAEERAGAGHLERLIQPFHGEIFPAIAGAGRCRDRALRQHEVRVFVVGAEARKW